MTDANANAADAMAVTRPSAASAAASDATTGDATTGDATTSDSTAEGATAEGATTGDATGGGATAEDATAKVASMTGYAQTAGAKGIWRWRWDLRSVNGRGLDLRLRAPIGVEGVEMAARRRAQAMFARGAVTLSLTLERESTETGVRINPAALERVVAAAVRIGDCVDALAPARIDGLLALRGVMETATPGDDANAIAARDAAILEDLDVALATLAAMRATEGAALAQLLGERLDAIAEGVDAAVREAEVQAPALLNKLRRQFRDLLADNVSLPEDRIAQEAAAMAVKADVREELDRLRAHVAQARATLSEGGAIGRKLDFLAQELNREANTLCSKSATITLTRIGLDLKLAIDQFREQAQNVE